jgi:hypothetical protein
MSTQRPEPNNHHILFELQRQTAHLDSINTKVSIFFWAWVIATVLSIAGCLLSILFSGAILASLGSALQ